MAFFHSNHVLAGLCCLPSGSTSYQQLPLQNVCVEGTLYDLCAEVRIQQTYVNHLHPPQLAECIYIFPLDEDSSVFSFEAELDGALVHGRIRKKAEARAEYDAAFISNHSAMLLEQSSDNIFQCKVGNLKYGSVCTITLTYLTLLEQEGRHNRLTLPMVIASDSTPLNPGLTPSFPSSEMAPHNTVHKGFHCNNCLCSPIIGTRHYCDKCEYYLCHGCYTQHCLHAHSGQTAHSLEAPALPHVSMQESKMQDLTIKLNITMPSPVISIQCPSHPTETKITQSNNPSTHASVFFHSDCSCSLSRDFILLVEQQHCHEPRALCELDVANHTAAVSLAFMPPPVDMLSASQIQCELVFLIDCSWSMSGPSITSVRECMQILLHSLPVHCYFNIITFGSTWSALFSISQPYDDTALSVASHHISGLEANMGSSTIYPPLLHVLTSKALPAHSRQVFLLTGGQASNIKQLAQLTAEHSASTRLFTVGIGASVNRLLCKELARAGRGKCEFVATTDGQRSAMREKVMRQVARAMQPALTDVVVDWGQLREPVQEGINEKQERVKSTQMDMLDSSPPNTSFMQCPLVAPSIFMSSRYMLHAMNVTLPESVWQQAKDGHKVDFRCVLSITARSNHPLEKEQMRHHSVLLTGEQMTFAGVIHTLAAKERIREIEGKVLACSGKERGKLEEEILFLATKYTLSSSRTSFVIAYNDGRGEGTAVEEMALSSKTGGEYICFLKPKRKLQVLPLRKFTQLASAGPPKGQAGDQMAQPQLKVALSSAPFANAEAAGELARNVRLLGASAFARATSASKLPENARPFLQPGAGTNQFASLTALQLANGSWQPEAGTNQFASLTCSSNISQKREIDGFEELVMLQSANGSWQVTPALIDVARTLACVDSNLTALTMQSLQSVSKEHGVEDVAVAVILALQLLETHFKGRHAEWEMLATKALFFLREICKVGTNTEENIKGNIKNVLCSGKY